MTSAVVTVDPDTTVENVASLLLDKRVSGVPVVDSAGAVLGIVSEGDLMRRPETGTEPRHSWWLDLMSSDAQRAGEFLKTHGLTAGDVMTKDVVAVTPDTSAGEVAEILERRHIKRVPVVDGGKLVGIVSRSNLLRALATHKHKMPTEAGADDESIRKCVLKEFSDNGLDSQSRINPIVSDGVVHLWGAVETEEEREAIRVAAQSIEGVKSVENHVGLLKGMTRAVYWAE
jgi:CBS domain-containing protein